MSDATEHLGPAVGTKFHPDGHVRPFRGNTVICPVLDGSPVAAALADVRMSVAQETTEYYTLLPASSWHMTAFELLCDQVRVASHWTRFAPLDAPVEETDQFLADSVASIPKPRAITMRFRCVSAHGGLLVLLDPADRATLQALASYRERLSDVTGIRFPDHDTYQFHIGLGYAITLPDVDAQRRISRSLTTVEARFGELPDFAIEPPSFRVFEDMAAFDTERRIANTS